MSPDQKRLDRHKRLLDLICDEINTNQLGEGMHTVDGNPVAYDRTTRKYVILKKP